MPIHKKHMDTTWPCGRDRTHAIQHMTTTGATTTIITLTTALVVNMDFNNSKWVSLLTALGSTLLLSLKYINTKIVHKV